VQRLAITLALSLLTLTSTTAEETQLAELGTRVTFYIPAIYDVQQLSDDELLATTSIATGLSTGVANYHPVIGDDGQSVDSFQLPHNGPFVSAHEVVLIRQGSAAQRVPGFFPVDADVTAGDRLGGMQGELIRPDPYLPPLPSYCAGHFNNQHSTISNRHSGVDVASRLIIGE
jgi:hypothetical protein